MPWMGDGARSWEDIRGFGAPPGARLFPKQRCHSAVAAHTAGTESRKGNLGKTEVSSPEHGHESFCEGRGHREK